MQARKVTVLLFAKPSATILPTLSRDGKCCPRAVGTSQHQQLKHMPDNMDLLTARDEECTQTGLVRHVIDASGDGTSILCPHRLSLSKRLVVEKVDGCSRHNRALWQPVGSSCCPSAEEAQRVEVLCWVQTSQCCNTQRCLPSSPHRGGARPHIRFQLVLLAWPPYWFLVRGDGPELKSGNCFYDRAGIIAVSRDALRIV